MYFLYKRLIKEAIDMLNYLGIRLVIDDGLSMTFATILIPLFIKTIKQPNKRTNDTNDYRKSLKSGERKSLAFVS